MTDEEDNTTPSPLAAAGPQRRKPAQRRSMLVFVAVFLTVTLVMLLGFQRMATARAMQRYLFHVAGHTAWVLDRIGDEGYIESKAGAAEATRWDSFQERLAKMSGIVADEQAYLAQVAEPIPVRPELAEQGEAGLLTYISEVFTLLDACMRRPGAAGGAQNVYDKEVWQAFVATRAEFDQAKALPADPPEARRNALSGVLDRIEGIRAAHKAFLEERLALAEDRLRNTGPTVTFVWRSGINTYRANLRAELNALRSQAEKDEADEQRIAALEEQDSALGSFIQASAKHPGLATIGRDQGFHYSVIAECGAIEAMAIYCAAVLAFPAVFWRRILGVLLGLPLLYVVNIGRLVCLALVGTWFDKEIFDFAHHYVWQALYIVFVVAVWLLWLELIVRKEKTGDAA